MSSRKSQTTEADLLRSLRAAGGGFSFASAPIVTTTALTRDEKHIVAEAEKQKLKIRAIAVKTAYAIEKGGEVQDCAAQTFANINYKIDAIQEGAEGSSSQRYIVKFGEFQRDQLAVQLATFYASGMEMIGKEITAPLPDGAPAGPRNIIIRLLGE